MLCSNRFPLPGSPTTCVLNTVVIPLPSFLLVIILPFVSLLRRKSPELTSARSWSSPRWLHITYMLLVAAAFGMTVLEIVRLALEHLGVGLLPMSSIATAIVFSLLWGERRGRTKELPVILMAYWLLLVLFEAVKVSRLHRLEDLHPAKDSKYPSSDQFLDNVVVLGLFFVFFCIEVATIVLSQRHNGTTPDSSKSQDAAA